MNLVVLITTATLLVPAPAIKQEGWAGQMIMLKKGNTPYRFDKNGVEATPLLLIEYRVLQDKGDEVIVVENGENVRVRKADVVLQSDALVYYSDKIEQNPNEPLLYAFRGWAHKQLKNLDSAMNDYDKAIELDPGQCAWRNNRALIWIDKKDYDKAIADYDESLKQFPQYALGYRNRGSCWLKKKEYAKALADFEKAVEISPQVPFALNCVARLRATCPDEKFRDGDKALAAAKKAIELTATPSGALLDTLAAAYAELGQFDEAIKHQEKAFIDPYFAKDKEKLDEARERLRLYREKKPFRDEGK